MSEPMKYSEARRLMQLGSPKAPGSIKAWVPPKTTGPKAKRHAGYWLVWDWVGIGLVRQDLPSADQIAAAVEVVDG
jgi:hypothetical protein